MHTASTPLWRLWYRCLTQPNPVPNKFTSNTISRCNLLAQPSFKLFPYLPQNVTDVEIVQETQLDPKPTTKPEPFTETQLDVVCETQVEQSNPRDTGQKDCRFWEKTPTQQCNRRKR